MSTTPYNDLLDATVQTCQVLGLPVSKRKLPSADENIDTPPLICVVPKEEPEGWTPFAFGLVEVLYHAEVVVIAAGQLALTTGLPDVLRWRNQLMGLFNTAKPGVVLAAVPSLWDTEIVPEVPIDRAKVNQNYDYSGFALTYHVTRPLGS